MQDAPAYSGCAGCPADLVFDPTPAEPGFAADLLLSYAMITRGALPLLTWVPLPIAGLDFQPQTRAASAAVLVFFFRFVERP